MQLGTDTWFYAKRCFCSLLEIMVTSLIMWKTMHLYPYTQAKHMIVLKDNITKDIIQFLEHCEGKEFE